MADRCGCSYQSAHLKQGQILLSIPFFFLLGLLSADRLLAGNRGELGGPGSEVDVSGMGTGGISLDTGRSVPGVPDVRGVGGITLTCGTCCLSDTCDPRASSSFCPGRPSSSDFAHGLLPWSSSSNEPVP
jgi:hypothetical protein